MPKRPWIPALLAAGLWMPAAPARAEIPAELAGRPVDGVTFEAPVLGVVSPGDVGIPRGAPLTRALVRRLIRHLLATSRFATVEVGARLAGRRVVLVVGGTPRLVLVRVDIDGNRALDDETLRRMLDLDSGSEIRRDGLLDVRNAVEAAYAERGYGAARAEVSLRETDDPTRVVMLIGIEEGPAVRIATLRFDAPPWLASEVSLASLFDLEAGDILDQTRLRTATRALEDALRGRQFLEATVGDARITTTRAGITVTVPVRPGPRFRTLVTGFAPMPRGVVLDALEGEGQPEGLAGESARRTAEERIRDACRRYGFLHAEASIVRLQRSGRAADLLVRLHMGPQVRVVSLSFPGSVHFEHDFLAEQVFSYLEEDLPGGGLFLPVDSNMLDDVGLGGSSGRDVRTRIPPPLVVRAREVYFEPTYREAIRHLEELYRAEGYLGARVGPTAVVERSTTEVEVRIPVDAGPRTILYEVEVAGNAQVGRRLVLEAADLPRAEPLSYLQLEEARLRIVDVYQEQGYLFARVEPTIRFSGDRTRASVTFEVHEGYPVHVGRIVVRGASRTSHDLIRDLLAMRPGDLYRPSAARESQQRLLELGIFTGATVGPADPDLPERVKPIVVQVSERLHQYLDASLGFATGEGVRGAVEYGYRNLFGYGLSLRLRGQLGYQIYFAEPVVEERFRRLTVSDQLERQLTIGLLLPHTPGIGFLRSALDFVHLRDNERDFGYTKNAVVLTLSSTYRKRRLILQVATGLENNTIGFFESQNLADYLQSTTDLRIRRLLLVPQGDSSITSVRPSISLDLRDSAFTPSRGIFATASLEWVRSLGADTVRIGDTRTELFFSNFLKIGLATTGYVPLPGGVVLAAQIRFGRIFHLQERSRTYPNRLFFLGGVDSLRGFQEDALIPQDVANQIRASMGALDPNTVLRGGDTFLLGRTELRIPITGFLHAGIFFEAGNLWVDPAAVSVLDLRSTGGVGARFATPVGFIALDYGINLARRRDLGEGFGAFHFSIGLF